VPDRGTLFDVGFNFREVGLVAGRLAADLLEGTDPRAVPIRETAQEIPPYLVLNLAVPAASPERWRIPDDLKPQARYLIDRTGRHDQPDAVLAGPFDEAAVR
jgi:hypothetical protein